MLWDKFNYFKEAILGIIWNYTLWEIGCNPDWRTMYVYNENKI